MGTTWSELHAETGGDIPLRDRGPTAHASAASAASAEDAPAIELHRQEEPSLHAEAHSVREGRAHAQSDSEREEPMGVESRGLGIEHRRADASEHEWTNRPFTQIAQSSELEVMNVEIEERRVRKESRWLEHGLALLHAPRNLAREVRLHLNSERATVIPARVEV